MQGKFHVQVELELHSISCPGVWLCPSSYVDITLNSLGYYFKTGPLDPKFPLLVHESFTMEGYFKLGMSLEKLERVLASEMIEMAMWQTGRRLAYYKGCLGRILQSISSHSDCHHINKLQNCVQRQSVVQLLMTPSSNFPGVLSPKIEISGRATVKIPSRLNSFYHQCHSEIPVYCPMIENNMQSLHDQRHDKANKFKRQHPVCHARKSGRCIDKLTHLQPEADPCDENAQIYILADKIRYRRNDQSTSSNSYFSGTKLSNSTRSQPQEHSRIYQYPGTDSFNTNQDHSKSCIICHSYIDIFRPPQHMQGK